MLECSTRSICNRSQISNLAFPVFVFFVQVRLRTSTTHPKFDPTRVRTHDLHIMTIQLMSLRRLYTVRLLVNIQNAYSIFQPFLMVER